MNSNEFINSLEFCGKIQRTVIGNIAVMAATIDLTKDQKTYLIRNLPEIAEKEGLVPYMNTHIDNFMLTADANVAWKVDKNNDLMRDEAPLVDISVEWRQTINDGEAELKLTGDDATKVMELLDSYCFAVRKTSVKEELENVAKHAKFPALDEEEKAQLRQQRENERGTCEEEAERG